LRNGSALSRGWLVVFAKVPRAGLVKTRMSPPLALDECAELYEAMLADVLVASERFARALSLEPVVAFHPPDAVADFAVRSPPGYRLQVQRGRDLAGRMAFASAEAAAAGAGCVLIRGSDSPGMRFECLEEAMGGLDNGQDVVLTPDQGGGYALIALRRPFPGLFSLTMSTSEVLSHTLRRAAELGLRARTTEPSFDLDTVEDLRLVEALPAALSADLCPRTVELISRLPQPAVL